jgi:hypothetical protein
MVPAFAEPDIHSLSQILADLHRRLSVCSLPVLKESGESLGSLMSVPQSATAGPGSARCVILLFPPGGPRFLSRCALGICEGDEVAPPHGCFNEIVGLAFLIILIPVCYFLPWDKTARADTNRCSRLSLAPADCRAFLAVTDLRWRVRKDLDGIVHYVEAGSVVDNPVHTRLDHARLDWGKRNHAFLAESLCCRLLSSESA